MGGELVSDENIKKREPSPSNNWLISEMHRRDGEETAYRQKRK